VFDWKQKEYGAWDACKRNKWKELFCSHGKLNLIKKVAWRLLRNIAVENNDAYVGHQGQYFKCPFSGANSVC